MEKSLNDKVKAINEGATSQEEQMKALAQIDEEGQLTDDVLDVISGGTIGDNSNPLKDIIDGGGHAGGDRYKLPGMGDRLE
jgi:hypothetical protein